MNPIINGTVITCALAAVLALTKVAQANSTVEKIRAKMESQSIREVKSSSKRVETQTRLICNKFYKEVRKVERIQQCRGDCFQEIKKYNMAVYRVMSKLNTAYRRSIDDSTRKKAPFSKMLGLCLASTMSDKRHNASYAFGLMLIRQDQYEDRAYGGMWAFTSLALGKGVPKSREAAVDLLTEVVKIKEMDQRTREKLGRLGLSLFKLN